MQKALGSADLRQKLEDQGLTVKTGTPEQFAQLIRSDIEKWGLWVKASGARAN
jgi:tripartite-type tricarboxylate transporter receptor subunit TctC